MISFCRPQRMNISGRSISFWSFIIMALRSAHTRGHVSGTWSGTSLLVCSALAHVAGIVRKPVHTKWGWIEAHKITEITQDSWDLALKECFYWLPLFCFGDSAHWATLNIGVILSLQPDARPQTCWISCSMLRGRNFLFTNDFVYKTGDVTRGNCRCNMPPRVSRPLRTRNCTRARAKLRWNNILDTLFHWLNYTTSYSISYATCDGICII